MGLFTVDVEMDKLPPSKDPITYDMDERMINLKEKKMLIIEKIKEGTFNGAELLNQNKDLKLIMKNFSRDL